MLRADEILLTNAKGVALMGEIQTLAAKQNLYFRSAEVKDDRYFSSTWQLLNEYGVAPRDYIVLTLSLCFITKQMYLSHKCFQNYHIDYRAADTMKPVDIDPDSDTLAADICEWFSECLQRFKGR